MFGLAAILWAWMGEPAIGLGRANVEYELSGTLALVNSVALTLFGAPAIVLGVTNRLPRALAILCAVGLVLWFGVLVAAAGAG